jgi:hypothetical protein
VGLFNIVDWDEKQGFLMALKNFVYLVNPLNVQDVKRTEVCLPDYEVTAVAWLQEDIWAACSTQQIQTVTVWLGLKQLRRLLVPNVQTFVFTTITSSFPWVHCFSLHGSVLIFNLEDEVALKH